MTHKLPGWSRLSGICVRAASFTLALAAMLASGMVATSAAQAQTFRVLHSFTGGTDSAEPHATVIQDAAGNLYGTTKGDSDNRCPPECGTVFQMSTAGAETILHQFAGKTDGEGPLGSLLRDRAGNLYGTTLDGGMDGAGTVFKVDSTGAETVLHAFTRTDGTAPGGALVRDAAGNFYGTTFAGGAGLEGTVFELSSTGKERVLYSFTGGLNGQQPGPNLIRDAAGNLYGTTQFAGPDGNGTIFKLDAAGAITVLYGFPGNNFGALPCVWVRDAVGNLYGNSFSGGAFGQGMVFKLDTTGTATVLYSFTGGTDGANALGTLVRDSAGNVYGTTEFGGNLNASSCPVLSFGCGTVFKIDTSGTETVLHAFTGGEDGGQPFGGLFLDPAGNLYGTTTVGGASGEGVVFEIKP